MHTFAVPLPKKINQMEIKLVLDINFKFEQSNKSPVV